MTKPVTIRDFEDRDREQVIAIARMLQAHESQYFDRLKPVTDIGDDYLTQLQADVAEHQGRFLVAVIGGDVVAYAILLTRCDSKKVAHETDYEYSYVDDLSVHENHRRKGVGETLIATCEAEARKAGMKWLRLGVIAENSMARDFYRKSGFRDAYVDVEKAL